MFKSRKTPNTYRRGMRGQAFAEYTFLLPTAIMLAFALSTVTFAVVSGLNKTIDGLNGTGVCEAAPEVPDEEQEGNTVAQLGPHTVRLTSKVFDGENTAVTYTVTNGGDPAISHWVLGLPPAVAANIISISEGNNEYGIDPTTGVQGLKFDTGYESSGGGGNDNSNNGNNTEEEEVAPAPEEESNNNGNNGNNGNNNTEEEEVAPDPEEEEAGPGNSGNAPGRNKSRTAMYDDSFILMTSYDAQSIDQITRDITLIFSGEYTFSEDQVSIKAGTYTYTETIVMPTQIVDNSGEDGEEEQPECE